MSQYKVWIYKEVAIKFIKSKGLRNSFNEFNKWIPGRYGTSQHKNDVKPEHLLIHIKHPTNHNDIEIQIPEWAIYVQHKEFRHSVPFLVLEEYLKLKEFYNTQFDQKTMELKKED